jgi:undecaprenyl pyrophosphate phosphatase UppP
MEVKKKSWLKNPSKKQVVYILAVWIIGITLIILSITDFFTESLFQKEYIVMYALIIGVTFTTFTAFNNYKKNQKGRK